MDSYRRDLDVIVTLDSRVLSKSEWGHGQDLRGEKKKKTESSYCMDPIFRVSKQRVI